MPGNSTSDVQDSEIISILDSIQLIRNNRNSIQGWLMQCNQKIAALIKTIKKLTDSKVLHFSYCYPVFRKICELRYLNTHWKKKLTEKGGKPQYRLSLFKSWAGIVYARAHKHELKQQKRSSKDRKKLLEYVKRGLAVDSFYAFSHGMIEQIARITHQRTNELINIVDLLKANEEQIELHGAPACFLMAMLCTRLGDNYRYMFFEDRMPELEAASNCTYQFALQYFHQACMLEPLSRASVNNAFLGKTIFAAFNESLNAEFLHSLKQACDDFFATHSDCGLNVQKAVADAADVVAPIKIKLSQEKGSL